jgi:hypothetical protein
MFVRSLIASRTETLSYNHDCTILVHGSGRKALGISILMPFIWF